MALTDVEYRSNVTDLSTLAIADLNSLLTNLGTDADEVRDGLLEAFPQMVAPYLNAAGELSAVWYEDLRAAAVGGTFYAKTADLPEVSRFDALVRWGVAPLYNQSDSTPLSLLSGGMSRLIADAGRDTIDMNARKDIVSTSWSRVARPGACEFCHMLAGRGPVYRSNSAAGLVIGRGVDPSAAFDADGNRKVGGQGAGVKSRGAQELASHYHDFCHCITKPTFYRREVLTRTVRGYKQQVPTLVPIDA